MTTNDARRDGSGLCEGLGPLPDSDWTPGATLQFSADQMRAYAAQAVAAERERCAKIVDPGELKAHEARGGQEGLELMRDLAASIREA